MGKLILTQRLSKIASLVRQGSIVVDVGTDHGYIPAWLIQNSVSPRAIATDISAGPLGRADLVAEKYGVKDDIDLRLCDGLSSVLPHEADTVIIAGMGGKTMLDILQNAPWTKTQTRLILQPQSKQSELRLWLYQNGYIICEEHLVRDSGKLYNVLVAEGGQSDVPSQTELYTGECWLHSDPELFCEYLRAQVSKLEAVAQAVALSSKPENEHRGAQCTELIAGMQAMLNTEGK